MSDDKMRAKFEKRAKEYRVSCDDIFAWQFWQAAYTAGRKAEREEVNCKIERLLTEFRHFIEEVEQTGIYYDDARVGTALANAWRVFDDTAAQIRGGHR
ncbi:MAG: hypothetical protein ACK6DA_15000 [Candidatus Kapaibacterium sp.]|jgi:hypothetical protein